MCWLLSSCDGRRYYTQTFGANPAAITVYQLTAYDSSAQAEVLWTGAWAAWNLCTHILQTSQTLNIKLIKTHWYSVYVIPCSHTAKRLFPPQYSSTFHLWFTNSSPFLTPLFYVSVSIPACHSTACNYKSIQTSRTRFLCLSANCRYLIHFTWCSEYMDLHKK